MQVMDQEVVFPLVSLTQYSFRFNMCVTNDNGGCFIVIQAKIKNNTTSNHQ